MSMTSVQLYATPLQKLIVLHVLTAVTTAAEQQHHPKILGQHQRLQETNLRSNERSHPTQHLLNNHSG
jgi:hypothetical protein